jgi:hypothetical protein
MLVGESSPLWQELRRVICRTFENHEWAFELFKQGLRPVFSDPEHESLKRLKILDLAASQSGLAMNFVGVTTGTAFAPIAANLYLFEFDHWLSRHEGFYARYGDDILFMAPAESDAEAIIDKARAIIKGLGLQANQKKEKIFVLSGRGPLPGLDYSKQYPSLNPAVRQDFEFLGWHINHRGDVRPNDEKMNREQKIIRQRAINTCNILRENLVTLPCDESELPLEQLKVMTEVINNLRLENSCGDINFTNRKLSRKFSTTIQKALDRELARYLSSYVTGIRGPKTFRRLSWRSLVNKFGLRNIQGLFFRNKNRDSISGKCER